MNHCKCINKSLDISPHALQKYLLSNGWKINPDNDKDFIYYQSRDSQLIAVPNHQNYLDYSKRLKETLVEIAEITNRCLCSVIADIKNAENKGSL